MDVRHLRRLYHVKAFSILDADGKTGKGVKGYDWLYIDA